ncbi:MAG TPA: DUF4268 domain-containing protein [Actinomycetota bacterium]|nr:DUF4268 domain-containing protein [Actinomycetota bacterium]
MAGRTEIERLELGRLERLDLRSFWGEQLPDLTPWFLQNIDLLSETLGIDITPLEREINVDTGAFNVLGTDALGRPIVIDNRLEATDHSQLGQLIVEASGLEAAVVIWVAPHFRDEFRRGLEWLNERTDQQVDFFGVEIGLVRIGRSLPAPVLDVVVQPRNWRKAGRRRTLPMKLPTTGPIAEPAPPVVPEATASSLPRGRHESPATEPPPDRYQPPPEPPPARHEPPPEPAVAAPEPFAPAPPPQPQPAPPPAPPPMASEQAGGLQPVELRHRFFEAMFDSVAIRRPGFRIPKFGYENWVGFAAGPFGFYDVAFTANGAVRAGIYLDMQERTSTKRLFDDLFAERLAVETAVGRILSWERLDDRRASRIVDYREIRDLGSRDERRVVADWAAETVVKLMEALDDRLRSTAAVLLSRVQGGV